MAVNIAQLFSLSGRTAVVTGGGTHIGKAIAEALAGCGADVHIAGRRFDVCEATSDELRNAGLSCTPHKCDAPWQILVDDELRTKIAEDAPEGWVSLGDAARALGVVRQTVLHRVQRSELKAVYVRRGRRKGLRIQVKRTKLDCLPDGDERSAQC